MAEGGDIEEMSRNGHPRQVAAALPKSWEPSVPEVRRNICHKNASFLNCMCLNARCTERELDLCLNEFCITTTYV